MTGAQWTVLAMLLIALAIELAMQPTTRGIFVRLFNTLNPIRNATSAQAGG